MIRTVPVHEGRGVGGEIEDRLGDLLGPAETTHRLTGAQQIGTRAFLPR